MTATNVSSNWSGGDLYFKDKSGNEILNIDGTNRALEVPSGSTLTVAGTLSVSGVASGIVTSVNSVSAILNDGAVTISAANKTYYITKIGVAAITIANPTAITHDGVRLSFISTTDNAHTLSNAAGSGFNAGGAGSDVATFGGAIGDNIVIEAYQGKWYVVSSVNVTLG